MQTLNQGRFMLRERGKESYDEAVQNQQINILIIILFRL